MKLSKRLIERLERRLAPAECPRCGGVGKSAVIIAGDDEPELAATGCAVCGQVGSVTRVVITSRPLA